MKLRLLFIFLAFSAGLHAAPVNNIFREVTTLLLDQAAAWNKGDIDAFMETYIKNDQLRFSSGDKVERGWKATLERYKKKYPDKAAMGKLAFDNLEVTRLADDAAIVFGRWQLTRENDSPHGVFTLTVVKTPAGWRILQDHTSSATP